MRIGSLIVLKEPAYLYQDAPMFPWDRLAVGTKLIVLGFSEERDDQVDVLVDDGRRGWIARDQILKEVVE